jgi:hypothetical protein
MAERRMFAKTIIDSDAFLDMPASAQALYFHLAMRADDDGFINNPKKVMRIVGASNDDAKILLTKRFLLEFDSGIIVIKHWWMHNYIQKDRYKPTVYQEERAQLSKKPNGAYTFGEGEKLLDTECIQDVSKVEAQDRLGKDRDRDRLELELGESKRKIDSTVNLADTRARDPFSAFVMNQDDQDLTDAILTWQSEMAGSGSPLSPKEQGEILDKLRLEFPRAEWLPAIRRSAERKWRTVYPRKEDKKAVAQKKQKDAWSEPVPAEETERLLRKIKEMEAWNETD